MRARHVDAHKGKRKVLLNLGRIVAALGGELYGDASISILGLAPLADADSGQLSFLSSPKYQAQLKTSRAACVIVDPAMREVACERGPSIITEDPYLYFAKLTQYWRKTVLASTSDKNPAVDPTAVIHATAQIHASARIGPLCVVESGAKIGADTWLKSRVTVSENCEVGERCILHSGVVVGADGFGFANNLGHWEKIEQLGSVRIGNDVEIGANTCIDRGALQDTIIGDGVKLDNLIQIGHNVRIGHHTAIAGCVGVAGSATIGEHCTIGGGAVVLGHLTISDNIHISAATVVTRSISKPGHYTGMFPIDDNAAWEKNAASLKQLHSLRERIRTLEKSLAETKMT